MIDGCAWLASTRQDYVLENVTPFTSQTLGYSSLFKYTFPMPAKIKLVFVACIRPTRTKPNSHAIERGFLDQALISSTFLPSVGDAPSDISNQSKHLEATPRAVPTTKLVR